MKTSRIPERGWPLQRPVSSSQHLSPTPRFSEVAHEAEGSRTRFNGFSEPRVELRSGRPLRLLLGLGLAAAAILAVQAQTPTADDFNPGANGGVFTTAVQADGRILLGGSFTTLGGQARTYVGRLNSDGTLDTRFNPTADGSVLSLAVQTDGKVLVGGYFRILGGQPRTGIGRLDSDGMLDLSFNPVLGVAAGEGFPDVRALAVQADGKILVGGYFLILGGVWRNYIGRLNSDGTADTTFNSGAGGGGIYPAVVDSLAVQADGKILVGGWFTTLGGQPRNYIGRLNSDGTLDAAFNPGASSYVDCLAAQADGKILVGGQFTTLGGQTRNYIGRLNADGSADTSFNPGASYPVRSLAVQADGKILVGGIFTSLGGQTRNYVGRLSSDGTLDTAFDPGASSAVFSLAVQADGKILVGGTFTNLAGQTRSSLGRLNATAPPTESLTYDGSTITWLRGGSSPEVWRTTFGASTNSGIDWMALGAGARVSGGWQLTGVSLATNVNIRARGFVDGSDNGSAWFVESIFGPLLVLSQPVSRTNNAGTLASFSVWAGGTGPLGYQWLKASTPLADGGNITGATTPLLTLSAVFGGDAGDYSVAITNAQGSLTSLVARLTVIDPVITVQPASQSREAGQGASFSVTAVGTAPLKHQWRKNEVNLSDGGNVWGANTPTLSLTNLQGSDAANYTVVVSNQYGCLTSSPAVLTVNLATADDFNPFSDREVYALAVQADGKILVGGYFNVLGHEWRRNIGRLNSDGTADTSFDPGAYGGDRGVYSLAVQADGKILVGGSFTELAGQTRNRIGRLSSDGTLDTGFNPGASSYVYSLAVQADGKILVGGYFTNLAGQARSNLGRLNADGSADTSFNPGANGSVGCLAVQADGKILVGGGFTTLGGQTCNRIGRLNSDGTLDAAFNPGANESVQCLAVQADGRILVGGYFTTLGGQTRNYIGRLNSDGTLDNTFNPGVGGGYPYYYYVLSLAVQADGKIVVGGGFTTLGGQTRENIGRLNSDGTVDTNFNPGASSVVYALAVQADGRVLVGGYFWTLAGQTRTGIGRLNSTDPATQSLTYEGSTLTWLRGSSSPEVWRTTFEACTNSGTDWMALGAGARVSGGWQLTGVSVATNANIRARGFVTGGYLNGSGWFVESLFGPPLLVSQPVSRTNDAATTATFAVTAAGTEPISYQWLKDGMPLADAVNISGSFTATLTLSNVLKADEANYSVVLSNVQGSVTSLVATLTVIEPIMLVDLVDQVGTLGEAVTFSVSVAGTPPWSCLWSKDGGILAQTTSPSLTLTNLQMADAGSYSVVVSNQYGSVTSAVAVLTVVLVGADAFNPGADSDVYALAVQADGRVLVGGYFSTLARQPRYGLGRLNGDGTLDDTFNPYVRGDYPYVECFGVQTDGKILVGGYFTNLAGETRSNIGRLNADGSADTSFNPEADSDVWCMALQPDGKILVGGWFTSLAGETRNGIGRLNSDGTLDTGFNPGADNWVSCLALQADGKMVVGGSFTTLGGQPRNCIGRLNSDGTLDTTFDPGAAGGSYPTVYSAAVQADGKIVVGGYFMTLAGQARNNIGRLNADGSADTTFDPGADGGLHSLAVQADGKIVVGGDFTTLGGQARNYLGRLNNDGTLDPCFNPGAGGDDYSGVYSLAVQDDGKILVGGRFDTLAGQARTNIGRLTSTDRATENLAFDGSTLTWLRGGTSPEVWRTTFDYSTNGTDWVSLGAGTRIPGGWQLTGLPALPNCTIRARGFVTCGEFNGSGSFVESAVVYVPQTRPLILVNDGYFGFRTNEFGCQFGFNLAGMAGQAVVIEGSTNLADWIPLATNLFDSSPLYFSDSDSTNFPARFYRARLEN